MLICCFNRNSRTSHPQLAVEEYWCAVASADLKCRRLWAEVPFAISPPLAHGCRGRMGEKEVRLLQGILDINTTRQEIHQTPMKGSWWPWLFGELRSTHER